MKQRPVPNLSRPDPDNEKDLDASESAKAPTSRTAKARQGEPSESNDPNASRSQHTDDAQPSSSPRGSRVADSGHKQTRLQGLTSEEFFYFFLRMRKGEVRRIVSMIQTRHPQEGPEQLATRLIASKTTLALLGGALVSLPWLVPGVGQSLKLAGIVGASSLLTRMNLYLINEIALVFGEDIDDAARVGDMMAVAAATAIGAAAPGVITHSLSLNPWLQLPTGALSSAATTQLIGQAAIRHFRGKAADREVSQGESREPALA